MSESYTVGQQLGMWQTGDNPGADALNANWIKIDLRLLLPCTVNPSPYPVDGLILRTDQLIVYQNTGTQIAPVWTPVLTSGSTPSDATATLKGILKLTGDLGGTADSPTVPRLVDFIASGASHAAGLVPDPGSMAGSSKFLCENATWSVPAGTSPQGTFQFGDGQDGALSLGSDTVLASGDNIKRYLSYTSNNHSLSNNTADLFVILYCSGTLDLGSGGSIFTTTGVKGTGGPGGTVGAGHGGAGGDGGTTPAALYVYASAITGTGTIKSSNNGVIGANSTGANIGGGANGGTVGGTPTANATIYGQGITFPSNAAGGNPGSTPNAGTGGTGGGTYSATTVFNNYKIINNWAFMTGDVSSATAPWKCKPQGGGGGGGGAVANPSGGGGGGGGGSSYGAGGAGATGTAGTYSGQPSGDSGQSGGGGGGGAGGGVVVVVTNSAPSTLTISGNGGNGGSGGSGSPASGFANSGNGGGGGGGGGGLAILIANSGNTATVTATGGSGGTTTGGSTATAGGNGISMSLVR